MMREPVAGTYTVALTGDVIMNTPVSACRDADVMAAVEVLRSADVTHAHLEIPLHDFAGADVFGAAEGALSWMRGPTRIADELRWLGVDVVSAASNHSLDYSYGGLRCTIEALDAVGLPHAGIGVDLAAARAPEDEYRQLFRQKTLRARVRPGRRRRFRRPQARTARLSPGP